MVEGGAVLYPGFKCSVAFVYLLSIVSFSFVVMSMLTENKQPSLIVLCLF